MIICPLEFLGLTSSRASGGLTFIVKYCVWQKRWLLPSCCLAQEPASLVERREGASGFRHLRHHRHPTRARETRPLENPDLCLPRPPSASAVRPWAGTTAPVRPGPRGWARGPGWEGKQGRGGAWLHRCSAQSRGKSLSLSKPRFLHLDHGPKVSALQG